MALGLDGKAAVVTGEFASGTVSGRFTGPPRSPIRDTVVTSPFGNGAVRRGACRALPADNWRGREKRPRYG
jgi:hypothetical protein